MLRSTRLPGFFNERVSLGLLFFFGGGGEVGGGGLSCSIHLLPILFLTLSRYTHLPLEF